MEKKRIIRRFILTLLILNTLSANIFSQKSYPVTLNDLPLFVSQLECEHGDKIDIPLSDISAHLEGVLPAVTSGTAFCPEVILTSSSNSSATFSWPATNGSQSYSTTFLGLSDGQTVLQQTESTEASFQNLEPQLGLFTFSSDIITANDTTQGDTIRVIIVDLEIFHGDDGFRCECNPPTGLLNYQESCSLNNHFFFPWVNTCPANKYYFNVYDINDGGTYAEPFYCVFKDTFPVPIVYALQHCNVGETPPLDSFFFGSNSYFQVMFTNLGVHFYLSNSGLENLVVSGQICDCYGIAQNPQGDTGEGRSAAEFVIEAQPQEMLLSPNPFNQEIQLSLPIVVDQSATIVLYDLSGKIVQNLSLPTIGGDLVIPTHHLAAGIYQIQVSAGGRSWQRRILKME